MRKRRFFSPGPLPVNGEIKANPELRNYLLRVLRLKAGSEIVLFNGDGYDYAATLITATRKACALRVVNRDKRDHGSSLKISLVQGMARTEKMDLAIRKSVELGIHTISLIQCHRSGAGLPPERLDRRLKHWQSVIVAACEQCGRASLPELRHPKSVSHWLNTDTDAENGMRLVLTPKSDMRMNTLAPPEGSATVVVGPEGGLEEGEVNQFVERGFVPLQFGPRILRTETAGPAMIAALQSRWGDMG